MFEIILTESQPMRLMYGFKREINRIVVNVDEPNEFFTTLQKRLTK